MYTKLFHCSWNFGHFLSFVIAVSACAGIIFWGAAPVLALTHVYQTKDSDIKIGMVVAAVPQSTQTTVNSTGATSSTSFVKKATQQDANLTTGIVIDKAAPTADDPADSKSRLFVSDDGQLTAYVSDVNGVPQPGDLLAPSPLAGILMRVTKGTHGIVGALIDKFPEQSAEQHTLKEGKKVKVAELLVNMDVHPVNQPLPSSLQAFVGRLTGRTVTEAQALAALLIAILTLAAAIVVVYIATSSYMKSVSRNPLAKRVLQSGFLRVLSLALGVVIAGTIVCWIVLWL